MSTSSATAEHEDALSSGVVFLSSEFMATAPHQARHDSSEIQVEDEGEPYSIDLTNDEAEPTAEDEDATISEGSVLSIESMPTIASQAQHIGSEIQVEDEGNGETNTLAKDDAESTPKFSFLAFPAEIRNLIYEMALVCGERHLIRCHSERYCTASLEAQQQRAVIMTNSIYTPWGRKSRGFGTSTPVAITLPKWRSSVQIESPAVSLFMVRSPLTYSPFSSPYDQLTDQLTNRSPVKSVKKPCPSSGAEMSSKPSVLASWPPLFMTSPPSSTPVSVAFL